MDKKAACNQSVISFLQEKKKKKPRIYWTSSSFMRAIDGARTRGLDLGKVARYQLRHYRIYVKDAESASEAGDGNRTHVSSLEGWCSTIELHPQTSGDLATCAADFQTGMPRTGIEPVTRGFSVLCSTN